MAAAAARHGRRQSETTHAAAAALDACAYFAGLLVESIGGLSREETLRATDPGGEPAIREIAGGGWRAKTRAGIESSGYVVHTLEAALWSVADAASFEDAVLRAANLGDDADTVAAVAGQLAGALWGASGIPPHWLDRLAWRRDIEARAAALFEKGLA